MSSCIIDDTSLTFLMIIGLLFTDGWRMEEEEWRMQKIQLRMIENLSRYLILILYSTK